MLYLYLAAVVVPPTILMIVDALVAYSRGGEELKGIPGYRRSVMAITVLLILGVTLIHIVVNTPIKDVSIVNNVLSMLAGLVSVIAGFYFGGKFAGK